MLARLTLAASLLAVLAGAAAPAMAQQGAGMDVTGGSPFHFTPYAGYMFFGHYLEGAVGTSLGNSNGPVYGAQLDVAMTPSISLVGNIAYSTSNLQIGVPLLGGFGVGHASAWLYDGDIQFRIPLSAGASRVTPLIQLGAGAMRINVDESILHAHSTNFAGNIGAGVDVQATPVIAIRLMVKDYVSRFSSGVASSLGVRGATSQNVALTGGAEIGF